MFEISVRRHVWQLHAFASFCIFLHFSLFHLSMNQFWVIGNDKWKHGIQQYSWHPTIGLLKRQLSHLWNCLSKAIKKHVVTSKHLLRVMQRHLLLKLSSTLNWSFDKPITFKTVSKCFHITFYWSFFQNTTFILNNSKFHQFWPLQVHLISKLFRFFTNQNFQYVNRFSYDWR